VVDRSAFDRIIEAGGFISVDTGSAPDANLIPVPKEVADTAFDAAACIGCGACVAACPNGAANLFTAAKISHLNLLPQGQAERWTRTENMVEVMEEYFGSCTNHGECEKACPKSISIDFIAMMNATTSRRSSRTAAHSGSLGFIYEHAIKGFSISLAPRAAAALANNPQVAYVETNDPVHRRPDHPDRHRADLRR
jgi:ferredoxin